MTAVWQAARSLWRKLRKLLNRDATATEHQAEPKKPRPPARLRRTIPFLELP